MSQTVAYFRVATQRQQCSGLGIEAPRAAVARFAEAGGIKIIAELVEAETGKGLDALDRRPGSWTMACFLGRQPTRGCEELVLGPEPLIGGILLRAGDIYNKIFLDVCDVALRRVRRRSHRSVEGYGIVVDCRL